jgi:hypothetical protein
MAMKISEADLALIGVSPRDLQHNLQHPDPAECGRRLTAMKDRTKKAFRKQALDLHPDRNPDADQDLFKRMTAAYDWVMALELTQRQRPQARPRPQANVVIIRTGGWSTDSTTSTTTMGGGGFGFNWRW